MNLYDLRYTRAWVTEFDSEKSTSQLSDEFNCSEFLIRKIKRRRRALQFLPLKRGRKIGFRKITNDDLHILKDIVSVYKVNSAIQLRHKFELVAQRKLNLSFPTIRRVMKEAKIRKKKINGDHPNKFNTVEKEINYFNYLLFLQSDYTHPIAFHDECHFERSQQGVISVYGSHSGYQVKKSDYFNESYTFSGVIQIDDPNFFIFDIIKGASDSNHYTSFLLSEVIPNLRPDTLLMVDGASFHVNRIGDIKSLSSQYGITYKRLPQYSPEFNPIELVWNILKMELKRETDITKPLLDCILDSLKKITLDTVVSLYFHRGYKIN